jgi:ADP-heptose:LPS heptosyltransferase
MTGILPFLRRARLRAENIALSAVERLTRFQGQAATTPKRILLFRNCFLGDFIVCFPALAALKQQYPEAHISLLNGGSSQPGERAKVNEEAYLLAGQWIENFITVQPTGIGRLAWLAAVRERVRDIRPDTAAILLYSDEGFAAKLKKLVFLRLAGVNCLLVGPGNALSTRWRTVQARQNHGEAPPNQVEAVWHSLKPLLPGAELPAHYPAFDRPAAASGRPPYAVIFPGSKSSHFNCWSPANYAALCRQLLALDPTLGIVLIGGTQDQASCHSIAAELAQPGRVESVAGTRTLGETSELLAGAKAYIGNDSGPMHLAAYVGCPVVAIFSRYQPVSYWTPWSERAAIVSKSYGCDDCRITHGFCHRGDYRCVTSITVDEVLQRAAPLLKLAQGGDVRGSSRTPMARPRTT